MTYKYTLIDKTGKIHPISPARVYSVITMVFSEPAPIISELHNSGRLPLFQGYIQANKGGR